MERTVRITGKGKIAVTLNRAIFSLNQSQVKNSYGEANDEVLMAKKELADCLRSAGIDKKDLKTERFTIEGEYTSYKKNDEWERELVGYRYNHQMKLKLDLDHEMVSKFLGVISDMKYMPEFEMSYSLKNPEEAKNKLIKETVKDSKKKELCLTVSLNVTLGEVLSIDYFWAHVEIISRPYSVLECDSMMSTGPATRILTDPDDIELEDSATVIWAIK